MEIFILLVIAGYFDYKKRVIPNELILTLYVSALFFSDATVVERIAGFLIPALPLFFMALKFKDLKGGDIKYLSAVGAFFGLSTLAGILCATTISAVVWCVIKKKESVPLAVFIAVGYVLYMIGRSVVA